MNEVDQYAALLAAIRILKTARLAVIQTEGYAGSPSWEKLYNANLYLQRQATALLDSIGGSSEVE